MKNILKKTVYIIIILLIIFILLSIFLYFFTRHHLDFQPENKDIDKIIIYGDVRSGYLTHIRIADMIYQEKPDMVIFTGDIASNSRNYIHYMQHTIFEKKLWDNAEYYPVRGNHESTYWLYDAFFDLPNDMSYYSFDRMGMHFIVLDVIDESLHTELITWLKDDLEKNKNKNISVGLHYPLFTSGKYEPFNEPDLLELFDKYNVMFVFSAHVHSYERSIYKKTNYIVTAGGGAPLYPASIENKYKVCRVNDHHYCVMTRNDKDEYTIKVIDKDGSKIDEVTSSKAEITAGKLCTDI